MLLPSGQCTWQKGTPHCEQRLAWVAAEWGENRSKISEKS
jgi:hypothetical protein